MPKGRTKYKRTTDMPDSLRARIKAAKLIDRLQAHIFDGLELSLSQVNGIRILLQKCLPDLTAVAVKADVTHRYVALLPEVLDKAAWIRKYGDPRQLEGTADDANGQDTDEPLQKLQ